MKTLPIVFACDKGYFKYTSVAICSIISNANKDTYYKIYVLSQDIDEKDQILMTEFIKDYKNFSLEFIIFNNIDTSKFYVKDYYTVSTYFRFYIPELFKQYDRILYLDSDLVVDSDISEFADMDFEDHIAIAVQDTKHCKMLEAGGEYWYTLDYFYNTLKMETIQQYFNAGIMLFNVKKMNEENISEKLFHNLTEIGNPVLQDQDIMNCVLNKYRGGVKLISNKYNYIRNIKINPYYISYKDIFTSRIKSFFRKSPKQKRLFYIYHFAESAKPWNSHRPDRLLFYKYLYSIHEVTPPKKFISEIVKENNLQLPIWWKIFMKFFS